MTNLSINRFQPGFTAENGAQTMADLVLRFFQTLGFVESNVKEEPNFLDAWIFTSNGQG